jgi:hypothetical protein
MQMMGRTIALSMVEEIMALNYSVKYEMYTF